MRARVEMMKEDPNIDQQAMKEIVHKAIIAPENPKYPEMDLDELQLSPQAEKLLTKFQEEVMESD